MKLRLLLFAVTVMFASCSGDDSSNTVNFPVENKNLKEISTYLNDGDDVIDELRKFENNRLTERYIYEDGVPYYTDLYTYENNLLVGRNITSGSDNMEQTIEYDSQGRISALESVISDFIQITEFDYTQEDKIIANDSSINSEGITDIGGYIIFYLNVDGLIYKMTRFDDMGSVSYETIVTYENENITSLARTFWDNEGAQTNTQVFTYDMDTPVKGAYLNTKRKMFGDSKTNAVIFYSNFIIEANRYVIASTVNNNGTTTNATNIYEFDSDGFPVKESDYVDNQLYSKLVTTYQ